jgi:membrane associated rhomboid family serine protease
MRTRQRAWAVRPQDAASSRAEARKALFVMVGGLVILWIIQLANVADHYQITVSYGIRPRDPGSLPDILSAPFLHVSWTHIESNSGPLFIFGFLAAYRGVRRFAGLSVLVIIVSGLAEWFTGASGTVGAGASGVVFGYLGYILVRGFFDRRALDIVLGAVMALCFAYQFTVLVPRAGIGWQAHVGGLVAGIAGGWLLRDRAGRRLAGSDAGTTASLTAGGRASAGALAAGTPAAPRPDSASLASPAGQPDE